MLLNFYQSESFPVPGVLSNRKKRSIESGNRSLRSDSDRSTTIYGSLKKIKLFKVGSSKLNNHSRFFFFFFFVLLRLYEIRHCLLSKHKVTHKIVIENKCIAWLC